MASTYKSQFAKWNQAARFGNTGIANPKPIVESLETQYPIELVRFSDHHVYSENDIERIHHIFANFDASTTVVLTTEKDAVKLSEMLAIVNQNEVPWWYLPIEVALDNEQELINRIQNYVESYPRSGWFYSNKNAS